MRHEYYFNFRLSFNKERTMAGFFCVQRIDVPEVLTSGEDCEVHDNIWFNVSYFIDLHYFKNVN